MLPTNTYTSTLPTPLLPQATPLSEPTLPHSQPEPKLKPSAKCIGNSWNSACKKIAKILKGGCESCAEGFAVNFNLLRIRSEPYRTSYKNFTYISPNEIVIKFETTEQAELNSKKDPKLKPYVSPYHRMGDEIFFHCGSYCRKIVLKNPDPAIHKSKAGCCLWTLERTNKHNSSLIKNSKKSAAPLEASAVVTDSSTTPLKAITLGTNVHFLSSSPSSNTSTPQPSQTLPNFSLLPPFSPNNPSGFPFPCAPLSATEENLGDSNLSSLLASSYSTPLTMALEAALVNGSPDSSSQNPFSEKEFHEGHVLYEQEFDPIFNGSLDCSPKNPSLEGEFDEGRVLYAQELCPTADPSSDTNRRKRPSSSPINKKRKRHLPRASLPSSLSSPSCSSPSSLPSSSSSSSSSSISALSPFDPSFNPPLFPFHSSSSLSSSNLEQNPGISHLSSSLSSSSTSALSAALQRNVSSLRPFPFPGSLLPLPAQIPTSSQPYDLSNTTTFYKDLQMTPMVHQAMLIDRYLTIQFHMPTFESLPALKDLKVEFAGVQINFKTANAFIKIKIPRDYFSADYLKFLQLKQIESDFQDTVVIRSAKKLQTTYKITLFSTDKTNPLFEKWLKLEIIS